MANTQTTVPLFVANQVLTASEQNLSAGTGVPVFATTVTRDAAFGGSNKALAEGQLCYLESTAVVQYYDGAAWATVGPAAAAASGFTFITSATLSAASTVSFNNCFSAAYNNYKIIINLSSAVVDGAIFARMRLSGTDATTNYSTQRIASYLNTVAGQKDTFGTDEFFIASITASTASSAYIVFEISNPALAQGTAATSIQGKIDINQVIWNGHTTATAYDGITIYYADGGTSITGTIRIYGYANS